MTITEQLRQIARDSGQSQYRIAADTGIPQSRLSDFMAGKGMRSENLDLLAKHFGVRLTAPRRKAAKIPD